MVVLLLASSSGPFVFSLEPLKNPLTFHYTDGFIGILIMVYYNPHITG